METVFIADAHLKGLEDPNQGSLVEFLEGLSAGRLVILGDLFDFWTDFGSAVYYRHLPVLNSLLSLRKKGVEIIYVEGNHDFTMGPFFTETLGARVCPGDCEMNLGGKRFYLSHGDSIVGSSAYMLWRRLLRSPLFRVATRISTPDFAMRVATFLSRRSREYSGRGERIDAALRGFAARKIAEGFDAVILGHSHVGGVHTETAGGRKGVYANPGGWLNGRSYLVYDGKGFRVERFRG